MKKYYTLTALLIFLYGITIPLSAFNPDDLSRSLVKITILENGVAKTTASGFVYKESRYIITSLHVMKPGAEVKIKIEYNNMACNARVVKVHQRADLVLLEVIPGASGIPSWTPLYSANTIPLKFAEDIFSIGFNSGSRSWISRKLTKGKGASEKLNDLIPNKDVLKIRDLGMPHLDLDVIYLDGSLLPGFSGAPLLNTYGQLVGIADGGLENGASNVSWGIPCREIDALFLSNISTLPSTIGHAGVVYSAEVNTPVQTNILHFHDYKFVHSKTRSLQQLLDRSDDKEALLTWLNVMSEIKVSYSSMVFDIYEDINNGFIITVPHGAKLGKAVDDDALSTKLNSAGQTDAYCLSYVPGNMLGSDGNVRGNLSYENMKAAQEVMLHYFQDSISWPEGLVVSEDVSENKVKEFEEGFLATAGFNVHDENNENDLKSYIYYKMIFTPTTSLVAFAFIDNYTVENMQKVAGCMQLKVNCADPATFRGYDCAGSCDLSQEWLMMLASVNLTTLANK